MRRTNTCWMIRYGYEQVYIVTVISSSITPSGQAGNEIYIKGTSVSFNRFFIVVMGRAVTRGVRHWVLTAKVLVQSQTSPCGICGGQSNTGTGLSTSTSFFPLSVTPVLQTDEFIHHRRYIILASTTH
jgi:hypothetical protein